MTVEELIERKESRDLRRARAASARRRRRRRSPPGMAARGKRVAVLTIDPARRLADSLGLPELGNEEHRVDPDRLAAAGLGGDGASCGR